MRNEAQHALATALHRRVGIHKRREHQIQVLAAKVCRGLCEGINNGLAMLDATGEGAVHSGSDGASRRGLSSAVFQHIYFGITHILCHCVRVLTPVSPCCAPQVKGRFAVEAGVTI